MMRCKTIGVCPRRAVPARAYEEGVMVSSKVLLQRAAIVVVGLGLAGVAAAHPGHNHDSWTADLMHLLHAWAPLLALLAIGVGGAATYRMLDRGR
jgi:hydrogenase/urease accessory protein HupE